MLNTLQRDILKRHIGPFFFCLITILFLLLLQFLILHIDKLVGKGLDPLIILELIGYQMAYMLVLAAPMSVLVATLMAYGKFSELSELTAIKAAGVTPLQLMKPMLVTALLLGVFLAWFSNSVLPESNFKARSLFLDIRMKKPGFDLRTNTFYDGIEGYTFLVREMSAEADTMFNLTIYQDATPTRDQAIIKAKRGILSGDEQNYSLMLDLYDGSVYRTLPSNRGDASRFEESLFEKHRIRFDMSDMAFSRTNPDVRRRDDRTMSAQAMQSVIDILRIDKARELIRLLDRNPAAQLIAIGPQHIETRTRATIRTIFDEAPTDTTQIGRESFPPVDDSPYFAMKFLQNIESQSAIALDASNGVRSVQSSITTTETNHRWRTERIAQFRVEIIKKIAIPFGCIIFVLIGAPLGMLTRKGNLGVNTVISAILFTYYWITIIQGEKLADRLIVSPFMGMWFGNITLGILGLILLYRVTSEKRIKDLWSKS
ncbi:MAG: LptF/LptG family permease [Balneolales bacterium]|nr:LptF/LptG family permease [Balneolales bacterium]